MITLRKALAATALATLLAQLGSPLLAQEQAPQPQPDAPGEDSSSPAPATAPPAQSGTESERDPTDYRSSEEISEDLSVSFPVDI